MGEIIAALNEKAQPGKLGNHSTHHSEDSGKHNDSPTLCNMPQELWDAYQTAGLALCAIPPGAKNPTRPGWPLHPLQAIDEIVRGSNVGLLLGPLSGGLVCVDLDFHAEDLDAWQQADELLPATGMVEGRPGKPSAHRYYRIMDPPDSFPDSTLPGITSQTRQAMDQGHLLRFPGTRHFTNGQGRGIDLLGAGSQAVIPPSRHAESGTCRAWAPGPGPGCPALIDYGTLLAAVQALADRLGMHGSKRPDGECLPPMIADEDLDQIAQVATRVEALRDYLAAAPPLAHGQGQGFHAQQWRLACACAELGVPFDQALPLYLQWNRGSATPDPDQDNQATLEKAYRVAVFGSRWQTDCPLADALIAGAQKAMQSAKPAGTPAGLGSPAIEPASGPSIAIPI